MKFFKLLFIVFVLLFFSFKLITPHENYVESIKKYEQEHFPEKTYLHTDKSYYNSEDTLWFKSYLVNGVTHKQANKSNVVYVELINPKDSILYKEKFFVLKNSFGTSGDIVIDPKWESGQYQLRAYTNYMRNQGEQYFFKKGIKIEKNELKPRVLSFIDPSKLNPVVPNKTLKVTPKKIKKINLTFYPEGGNALVGFFNKYGIKAVDEQGNGVKLVGKIKEKDTQKVITVFRTFDYGLGNIGFIPQLNKEYIAEITLNGQIEKIPITEALTEGVQLNITNKKTNILLTINSKNEDLKGYSLIGHLRGKLFFEKIIDTNSPSLNFNLVSETIPNGIAQFTLFNSEGKPKAERLVFIDNPRKTSKANIVLQKREFKKRERVNYSLTVQDAANNKKNASLSVAVTHKNSVPLFIKDHIKSWLLLNSDLRGEIPNASVFFDESKSKNERDYLLESLMLTHGWRRFTWEDTLKITGTSTTYTPEFGLTIRGTAEVKSRKLQESDIEVTLLLIGKKGIWSDKKIIKANSEFAFENLVISEGANVVLQGKAIGAKSFRERKVNFTLSEEVGSPEIGPLPQYVSEKENLFFENYKKRNRYLDQVNFTFSKANQLDEVIIEGKKKKEYYDQVIEDRSFFDYGTPQNRVILDSVPGLTGTRLIDLLATVRGVRVLGEEIFLRGSFSTDSAKPLFFIDGLDATVDDILFLSAEDVSFIDVLTGSEATILGPRANSGVIAIYTKEEKNTPNENPGIHNFELSPFYKAKEFFNKKYLTELDKQSIRPDYRTTLHWNPRAYVLKNKETSNVTFYTGDQLGVFQFELEGVTEDGELIYETAEIEVVE